MVGHRIGSYTQSFLFDLRLFPTAQYECFRYTSARLICLSCHNSSVSVSVRVVYVWWFTYIHYKSLGT